MRPALQGAATALALVMLLGAAGSPLPKPRPGAASETPLTEPGAINWLAYKDGIAKAQATGFPMLVWITSGTCPRCASQTFEDPDVVEMLADFVPVLAPSALAEQLALEKGRAHAVLLDGSGAPLPDLTVSAQDDGTLPVEDVIDLMSSGLDVVR